jgi:pyruvate/2-oxoacid:ferredoxin oxidoreductase alpha subunit
MLPVLVNAEGFLLSHTAEVVDVPEQDAVDGFIPPFDPPADWLIDPGEPRAFSELPEPRDYAAFQRNVSDAHDEAREAIEQVAWEFTHHFDREKVGALDVAGNPQASKALVTLGTIGESALELLDEDDDLLLVRVHAFRPFPAAQLESLLGNAARIAVIDRAPAFGALGPLGADVRSLDLGAAEIADVVAGVGGTDVTPVTLRWALEHARAGAAPVHVPEGVA